VCCAGVSKPREIFEDKARLVVQPAEPHPIGSEEAEEHERRLRLLLALISQHGRGIRAYRPECTKRNEPLLKVTRSWSVGLAHRTRGAAGRFGTRRCSACR
jgi:hypothetical protein